MKTASAFAGALMAFVFASSAAIPNFPTANLVLGQTNFTSDLAPSPPTASSANSPFGVAVDPVSGKVWVADSVNHRVLRYASAATLTSGAAAEIVLGQATFADNSSNQGGANPQNNTLDNPTAVFVDSQGRLWIADAGNNRVLKFNNSATVLSNAPANVVFGQPDFTTDSSGVTSSKMSNPIRIWLDQNDRLWVADAGNHRVLRFNNAPLQSSGASASGVLGQSNFTSNSSGTTHSTFNSPAAVTVDSAGRLYVVDTNNHRVLRFDNAATLDDGASANAVLGQPNFNLNTSGFGAAQFNTPIGIFADATGTLWVADAANSRVVRFDNAATKSNGAIADGVVGQPDFSITTSGLTAQKLSLVTNVWVDGTGALWVADSQTNNRILRFSPVAPPPSKPPVVKISGKKTLMTTKARVTIRGVASDASGIRKVRFKIGNGKFKNARGTTSWNFTAQLKLGKNRIVVQAVDKTDASSTASVMVIRKKP